MTIHISNNVQIFGQKDNIKLFWEKHFQKITDNTYEFDFNTIIPMPQSLQASEACWETDLGIAYWRMMLGDNQAYKPLIQQKWAKHAHVKTAEDFLIFCEDHDSILEKGKKAILDKIEYGFFYDYEWALENWGTRTNAYCTFVDFNENQFVFFTKCSPPIPVFNRMAALWPTLRFDILYKKLCCQDEGFLSFFNGKYKEK